MDYEIYDQVIAWTLERGDNILVNDKVYNIDTINDDQFYLVIDGIDEWGDTVTLLIDFDEIVSLVEIL